MANAARYVPHFTEGAIGTTSSIVEVCVSCPEVRAFRFECPDAAGTIRIVAWSVANGLGLKHLRLDELVELAGVSKTSFYRVWPNKEAFLARLLEDLVSSGGNVAAGLGRVTIGAGWTIVEEYEHLMSDAPGRHRVLTELIRQVATLNFQTIVNAPAWQTFNALLATLPGIRDDAARDRVFEALIRSDGDFRDTMANFSDQLCVLFQYRYKPGFSGQYLAAAGAAAVEGLAHHMVVNPELVATPVQGPAIEGSTTDWHLSAWLFHHLVMSMLAPVQAQDP